MKIIDKVGWLGNICLVSGALFIAQQNILGLVLNVLGNLCYIYYGHYSKSSSILALSFILGSLNVYGIFNWLH